MRPRVFIFVILALGLVAAGFVFAHHSRAAREKEIMAGFTALMAVEDLTVAEVVAYLDEQINAAAKEKAGHGSRLKRSNGKPGPVAAAV